jgi:hypothetical protein
MFNPANNDHDESKTHISVRQGGCGPREMIITLFSILISIAGIIMMSIGFTTCHPDCVKSTETCGSYGCMCPDGCHNGYEELWIGGNFVLIFGMILACVTCCLCCCSSNVRMTSDNNRSTLMSNLSSTTNDTQNQEGSLVRTMSKVYIMINGELIGCNITSTPNMPIHEVIDTDHGKYVNLGGRLIKIIDSPRKGNTMVNLNEVNIDEAMKKNTM